MRRLSPEEVGELRELQRIIGSDMAVDASPVSHRALELAAAVIDRICFSGQIDLEDESEDQ